MSWFLLTSYEMLRSESKKDESILSFKQDKINLWLQGNVLKKKNHVLLCLITNSSFLDPRIDFSLGKS